MSKFLVWVALLGLAMVIVVGFIAPNTPDGSWLHEFGNSVRDALSSFFGNPVTVK